MEEKDYEKIKEAFNKALEEKSDSENRSSDIAWLSIMILLMFGGIKNTENPDITKMKEDIAELKGKMSIIEKTI